MALLLLAEGADPNAEATWLEHVKNPLAIPGQEAWADPRAQGYVVPVKSMRVCETALHRAVRLKLPRLVGALLAAGADRQALRTRGESTQSVSQLAGTAPSKEMVSALATVEGFAADDRTRDLSLRAVAVVTILCSIVRPSRWSPDNHRYFGSALQERVRTTLLVVQIHGSQRACTLHEIIRALSTRSFVHSAH
jgi:hypothetical protein